jgi:DNA-directed RNA polymerase specialized sigma24 family protein
MRRVLRRTGARNEDIDDLVGDAWVFLLAHTAVFSELAPDAQARYASRVAIGLAGKAARSRSRRERREAAALASSSTFGAPDLALREREALREFLVVLLSLRTDLGRMILDHGFDGLSASRIAVVRGLPVGTVKSWLRQAKQEISRALQVEGERPLVKRSKSRS